VTTRKLSRLGQIFADGRLIDEAMRAAVKSAIQLHKQHGVPMAISRDGKVVLVPAEELEAEQLEAEKLEAEKLEKKRSRKATGTVKRPPRQKRAS